MTASPACGAGRRATDPTAPRSRMTRRVLPELAAAPPIALLMLGPIPARCFGILAFAFALASLAAATLATGRSRGARFPGVGSNVGLGLLGLLFGPGIPDVFAFLDAFLLAPITLEFLLGIWLDMRVPVRTGLSANTACIGVANAFAVATGIGPGSTGGPWLACLLACSWCPLSARFLLGVSLSLGFGTPGRDSHLLSDG